VSTSRRHHYVPQFYLRAFTSQQLGKGTGLWVYDKRKPSQPRFQTPVNTVVKAHFYSFQKEGKRHDLVEQMLAAAEAAATPIVAAWQKPGIRPRAEDIPIMAEFLALMYTRVPRSLEAAREMIGTISIESLRILAERPGELESLLDRYKAETGQAGPSSAEELREDIRHFDERFKLEVGDRYPLALSFTIAPVVVQQMITMNWCICDAPSDAFFITGDCPLTSFVPVGSKAMFGGGLALPAVELTFPLSPTVCLMLDRKGRHALRRRTGADFVYEINRRTAFAAERYVISSYATKRVAEWVQRGARSIGHPKTDKRVLARRLRARMSARASS
jgi:Protein of unknown function (DUF4238)